MAVILKTTTSTIYLRVLHGVNTEGNNVFRKKGFPNVKSTATDQGILDVALALKVLFGERSQGLSLVKQCGWYDSDTGIPQE